MPRRRCVPFAAALAVTIGASLPAPAEQGHIILQSTTSTEASGLYEHLLPKFEEKTGIEVRVVAVGTGQALKNARNCDGDALLVHDREAEARFVAEGFGVRRIDVMYNDFVIVGPAADPVGVARAEAAEAALARIAEAQAPFVSRGDESGTHKAERALWQAAGIDPTAQSGTWYREAGSGMGATLNTAVGMGGYALADRASWTAFANKRQHQVLFEGDPALRNQYGAIPVSPEHCPNVNAEAAARFVDWLTSAEGQAAIAAFRVDLQQVFTPNGPD